MQAERAKKSNNRSKITNGSKLGTEMDGRTVWARRLRDLIELYSSDIGDIERIPHSKQSLIRRAATLTVELERAEAGFALVGKADPDALNAYQTTANSLRRILESLNVKATVKEASDVARVIEGGRVVKEVVDKFGLPDLGVVYGREGAKYEVARRIAFAVKLVQETGEPMPPELAKMAVDLALADYADEDGNVPAAPEPLHAANDRGLL